MAESSAANRWLMRRLGVRLTREAPRDPTAWGLTGTFGPPRGPEDRLLTAPVFVLSCMRSGSTLLRLLLDSHSQIHAPQEMHLADVAVDLRSRAAAKAMEVGGLDRHDLEHLLWDRALHRLLVRSGKSVLAEKTPGNVFLADRLAIAWPDARFVYLLRDPAAIVSSWYRADLVRRTADGAVRDMLPYMDALERARTARPGHTVRYEELTADPEREMRRVCEFLELAWEPELLDYGSFDHGPIVRGLGDWRPKIRTGVVQRAAAVEDADVPAELAPIRRAWGY